jgi:signal transduction histidine kinase
LRDKETSINQSPAVRFLAIAVLLTELFIAAFGINTYRVHRKSESVRTRDLRVIELRGRILQWDEVLTMSARMAAVTGNLEWEKRYRDFEPKLDAAIKETIRLAPGAYSDQAAKQTDEANLKLVELEHQAFEKVRAGLPEEARAILFSPEYEQYKKVYTEGMDRFAERLKQVLHETAKREARKAFIYLTLMLGVAVLLFLGWILILRAIQTWEPQLIETNRQLRQKTQELNELNKTLDQRIKERTEELAFSQTALAQSEKMAAIGQLASGIAHEINNPLGVILGFSQNVAKKISEGDPLELPIKSIEREAVRCKNLVQDLLLFARVEKPEKEQTDLKAAIETALSLVLTQSRVSEVELVKELSDVPLIRANPIQIQQVILNLSNNAMDAMPKGGKLTVRLRTAKNEGKEGIEIQVQDTGQGIPAEIRSKVFNPFFTTKDVGKGTGLGLSLVYEIVGKHHGKIGLDSETGKGTVFTIFLPL